MTSEMEQKTETSELGLLQLVNFLLRDSTAFRIVLKVFEGDVGENFLICRILEKWEEVSIALDKQERFSNSILLTLKFLDLESS